IDVFYYNKKNVGSMLFSAHPNIHYRTFFVKKSFTSGVYYKKLLEKVCTLSKKSLEKVYILSKSRLKKFVISYITPLKK
ncbi:hypothetical protein ACQ10P_15475, partial [Enterococcus faecalis]|uniref:hypothetical protein n=1 Tax=Enterococcus faecalis TaxID=1351 RepID=UPI003D6A9136